VESDFQKQFMEAMQLPHITHEFPHLEGIVPDEILHQLKDVKPPSDKHMK